MVLVESLLPYRVKMHFVCVCVCVCVYVCVCACVNLAHKYMPTQENTVSSGLQ